MKKTDIFVQIEQYYADKIKTYGATPEGVDWNSAFSQVLRFDQLLKIVDKDSRFSLLDVGCGYGALFAYLDRLAVDCDYFGLDISSAMIDVAQEKYSQYANAKFMVGDKAQDQVDYVVSSGIFNVKLNGDSDDWVEYIKETLNSFDRWSKKGFSFNCLTNYSDQERMRGDLYYADPAYWFDFCKKNFSRNVALLHDYGLYEFTIIVRRDLL